MPLRFRLFALRHDLAAAAQAVISAWTQDAHGWDEEFGTGGACDHVADAMQEVITAAGIDSVEGGQDGDDHAWLVAYDAQEAFAVDIPPGAYERGGGYVWRKLPGARVDPEDVVITAIGPSADFGLKAA